MSAEELAANFKPGDVVYTEGASAILGDVIAVEDDGMGGQDVTVAWRPVTTTESDMDLVRSEES
jgi:hypothetical protein